MNIIKELRIAVLAFAGLFPVASFAGNGYSEYENHRIWEARLAAQEHAAKEAAAKCHWTPDSATTFADQLPTDEHPSNERLFLRIMAMHRLDQNARAISIARGDDESRDRVGEVDAGNLPALKEIISTYGFPTPEEVGATGANAMMVMVAHADEDLEFQKSVARTMDDEVAKGVLPAMFPLILKTIRPQITGAPRIPDSNPSDAHPKPTTARKLVIASTTIISSIHTYAVDTKKPIDHGSLQHCTQDAKQNNFMQLTRWRGRSSCISC